MDEIPLLLRDIILVFAMSIGVILLCHQVKLPTIVGFLLTGVLAGPSALGIIDDSKDVQQMASIGIVLLLFAVGLEFSLKRILEYRRFFLFGGFLQVLLTICGGFIVGQVLGRPPAESLFLGFILSLSSTAIVLRLLEERGESHTHDTRAIVGILIFQDIVAIPMMLATPLLGAKSGGLDMHTLWALLKGLLILGVVVAFAIALMPRFLYLIAKTRSRELFLLSVLTVCFSTAWLASSVGMSLSLGAFLAGLIVSDSEYRHQAVGDILPFQDIFTSFFFISIGMLLNTSFFAEHFVTIILMTFGVIFLKGSIASMVGSFLGMPLRSALKVGFAISQIGEFSFVLIKVGYDVGLATDYYYQLFLAVALMTMALTPLLIAKCSVISHIAHKLPWPDAIKNGYSFLKEEKQAFSNHLVIIGFGLSGRHLAAMAKQFSIPYTIVEMNPETVKTEKLKGEPIHFGDASHATILNMASIESAKAIAIVINDPAAAHRITVLARSLNENVHIIVRTRYLFEMPILEKLGASEVVPDEFGSSIEVFTRTLKNFGITNEKLQPHTNRLREESYHYT